MKHLSLFIVVLALLFVGVGPLVAQERVKKTGTVEKTQLKVEETTKTPKKTLTQTDAPAPTAVMGAKDGPPKCKNVTAVTCPTGPTKSCVCVSPLNQQTTYHCGCAGGASNLPTTDSKDGN